MRLVYKLCLTLLASALSLGAAEAFFRHEEGTVVFPWHQPGRGFATQPHTRGANARGFHEREIPPGEAPHLTRVVVVGDSMTWGTGTAEQTWTRAMEARLFEDRALLGDWQVLNFGHYGYDAEASAATLRDEAADWRPDIIVFATYTNDVLRNTTIELGRFGYPVWIGSAGALLPDPLRHRSALARAVEGALLAPTVREQPDLAFYRAQLADMKAQAAALGAELIVYGLVPHVFAGQRCEADADFCEKHRAWHEAEREAALALQIPFYDGAPAYNFDDPADGSAPPSESFYPDNPQDHDHPNPEGHRRLGRYLANQLILRQIFEMEPGYPG